MRFRRETRVVGFDDAPFGPGQARVPVLGIVMRGGEYVEAVLRTDVARDGDDATARIADAVRGCRASANLTAVLLQNLMVAGFNTIDAEGLHEATGLPVVAVARGVPDLPAMQSALRSGAVPGGEAKWDRIANVQDRMVPLRDGALTITPVGLDAGEAERLLELTTVRGHMPEPLRLAHLIGAGWVLGESKGQ